MPRSRGIWVRRFFEVFFDNPADFETNEYKPSYGKYIENTPDDEDYEFPLDPYDPDWNDGEYKDDGDFYDD